MGVRAKRAFGMGMTLSTAESVFFWSNWILVVALILGVVATFFIVVSGNVKEAAAKIDSQDAAVKIAEANAVAQSARLELAKLKSPRALSEAAAVSLVEELKQTPVRSVFVGATNDLFEAAAFSEQLVLIAEGAGYSAARRDGAAQNRVGTVKGVVVAYTAGNKKGKAFALTLAQGLSKRGIAASAFDGLDRNIRDAVAKQMNKTLEDDNFSSVVIAVGDKF